MKVCPRLFEGRRVHVCEIQILALAFTPTCAARKATFAFLMPLRLLRCLFAIKPSSLTRTKTAESALMKREH